jgi:MoaA/NifB/PqqE/SkfB family radical SAM enzyme
VDQARLKPLGAKTAPLSSGSCQCPSACAYQASPTCKLVGCRYISPYGDFYPCLQLHCGNVRRQRFIDIWKNSPQLAEVRSICTRNLPVCSTCAHVTNCTRCPDLAAYMEGNVRGPSTADCEKSYVCTGIFNRQRVPARLCLLRVASSE